MKLLIIEDDETLAGYLRDGLSEEGHVVDVAFDGDDGEYAASRGNYDAIVLDIMIPGKDGIGVVSTLRVKEVHTPVLMLTARDTLKDVVSGLDAGADDYLRKPFEFDELLARLRSLTRRKVRPVAIELRCDDVVFNLTTRRVFRGDTEVRLTTKETAYLEYFMQNVGVLVTRPMLETALWNDEMQATSNVIDVYIKRLRTKLDLPGRSPLLHTVRGAGYRFGLAP